MRPAGWQLRYAAAPDIWAGVTSFLFYEEGNTKARVSPDVMLAKGVVKWSRPNYLLWKERPPSLIVEVTSESVPLQDLRRASPAWPCYHGDGRSCVVTGFVM